MNKLLLHFPAVYRPGPVASAQPTPASIQWVASLYVWMRQNVFCGCTTHCLPST